MAAGCSQRISSSKAAICNFIGMLPVLKGKEAREWYIKYRGYTFPISAKRQCSPGLKLEFLNAGLLPTEPDAFDEEKPLSLEKTELWKREWKIRHLLTIAQNVQHQIV